MRRQAAPPGARAGYHGVGQILDPRLPVPSIRALVMAFVGLAACLGVAWWSESYPYLDGTGPAGGAPAAAGALVACAAAWRLVAGQRPAARAAFALLWALPGAFGGFGAVQLLNGALDRHAGAPVAFTVRTTEWRHSEHRGVHYLRLTRPGEDSETLALGVSPVDCEWTPPGSVVEVSVRPGALGAAWVAGYVVTRRATPELPVRMLRR